MAELVCAVCGEEIDEDSDYTELEDGRTVCEGCSFEVRECCICGKMGLEDEMESWGDDMICQDCLEEVCPNFIEEDNERETQKAYEAMLGRYVGKHVLNADEVDTEIEYELEDPCVTYRMSVDIDEDGCIKDISRLSAELLLSEWVNGSKWRAYPIENDDYTTIVDEMLTDYEFGEEE